MSGYNFDEDTKTPELSTQTLIYLSNVDGRIRGVEASIKTEARRKELEELDRAFPPAAISQEEAEPELKRLAAARKDILSQLSKEEKAEYTTWLEAMAPKELTPEQQAALTKRLDQNRDRASH